MRLKPMVSQAVVANVDGISSQLSPSTKYKALSSKNKPYGFLVVEFGILTGGGFGPPAAVSFLASRPVLVNAIRCSEPEGWSTDTLIARNVPSWALLVGS